MNDGELNVNVMTNCQHVPAVIKDKCVQCCMCFLLVTCSTVVLLCIGDKPFLWSKPKFDPP